MLAIDPSTKETGWAVFCDGAPTPTEEGAGAPSGETSGGSSPTGARGGTFHPRPSWELVQTGVITVCVRPRQVKVEERVSTIAGELDTLVGAWQPREVACGTPSILQFPHLRVWVDTLTSKLKGWTQGHRLPLYCYSLREIRACLVGRANGAREELAYAVMTRWGLVGEGKTTHEWNAIAVGDYHLGFGEAVATGA